MMIPGLGLVILGMGKEHGVAQLFQQGDKLLQVIGKGTSMLEAFRVADDVLRQGIQGITELIVKPALVNLDFADVRTVMSERGVAHMGIGVGYGDNKTMDAAKQAIQSPLLETSIEGARGILYNVTGDPTMSLLEIEEAANLIRQAADPDANIFFGADTDDTLEDEVRITVIATGFVNKGVKNLNISEIEKAKPINGTMEDNKQKTDSFNYLGNYSTDNINCNAMSNQQPSFIRNGNEK
jgi:cell division GTPase FtsZ